MRKHRKVGICQTSRFCDQMMEKTEISTFKRRSEFTATVKILPNTKCVRNWHSLIHSANSPCTANFLVCIWVPAKYLVPSKWQNIQFEINEIFHTRWPRVSSKQLQPPFNSSLILTAGSCYSLYFRFHKFTTLQNLGHALHKKKYDGDTQCQMIIYTAWRFCSV